ncbi:MAG: hypothetical protein WCK02_15660 [Bacteroidota bacterium]
MRKFISIFLLFIFSFNIGGYFVLFNFLALKIQREIKLEIRKGIPDKELTLIITLINNESSLSWVKKNKEFFYKGEMYDVVRTRIVGNKKYYYSINDKKEKNLVDNFNKAHNSRKKSEKTTKKININSFVIPQSTLLNSGICSHLIFSELHYTLTNIPSEIPSPPPNFI